MNDLLFFLFSFGVLVLIVLSYQSGRIYERLFCFSQSKIRRKELKKKIKILREEIKELRTQLVSYKKIYKNKEKKK